MHVMEKDNFIEYIGEANFKSNIMEALDYAEKFL